MNAEYERLCLAWWGVASPFRDWIARYKTYLQENHLPLLMKMDGERAFQFKLFGIPAEGYQSTSQTETTIRFMERIRGIFAMRRDKPHAM